MSSGVETLCDRGWYPPRLSSRRRSIASSSESSTSSTRRVSTSRALCTPALRNLGLLHCGRAIPQIAAREGEMEGGAAADSSLRPDSAAVPVNDARHRRQADPSPLEFVLSVQSLEGSEQLVCVRLVESGPVVPHVVNGGPETGPGSAVGAELYAGFFFPGGELPRVAEQVFKRHLEQAHIPPGHDVLPTHELDLPPRFRLPQVVYERGHVLARRPYATEVVHSLVV